MNKETKKGDGSMKKQENMRDLFLEELRDIYNGEQQIINALPAVIKAADSDELKEAFQNHLEETHEHVERLEAIFKMMNEKPGKEICEAMKGLIHECSEAIHEYPKSALRDAAIISKAQRIEHYEISAYGTLRTFAKELDFKDAAKLLQATLDEEANADKTLTKIAEGSLLASGVNHKAIV